jgi:WD40 repeat protein
MMKAGDKSTIYDIFITYAHADKDFARRIQNDLQSYSTPIFSGLKPRRLRMFRDESEAAETRVPEALTTALEKSRKQLVICSPASRDRRWVDEEIRIFAKTNGPDNIVPILIAGRPNSEADSEETAREAAFSAAIIETFGKEPWAPDFRSVNAANARIKSNRAAWFHLLANIYGTSRQIIEHRERQRTLTRGVTVLAVASIIGFAGLEYSKVSASYKKTLAESESRALADRVNKFDHAKNEEAIRFGLKAIETAPTEEAIAALRSVVSQRIQLLTQVIELGSGPTSTVTVDAAGQTIAVASPLGRIRVWRARGRETQDVCGTFGPLSHVTESPDGNILAWFDNGTKTISFWDTVARSKNEVVSGIEYFSSGNVQFSPNSKAVAFLPFSERHALWRVTDGTPIAIQSNAITFSHDGEFFVEHSENSIDSGRKVAVRQTSDGAIRQQLDTTGAVTIARFSTDNMKVVMLSEQGPPDFKLTFLLLDVYGGTLKSFDSNTFDMRELLKVEPRDFDPYAFRKIFSERLRAKYHQLLGKYGLAYLLLATQNSVAVGIGENRDGRPQAFAFDPVTLKIYPPLSGLVDQPREPALSPNGRVLADGDGPVWDTTTGVLLWRLPKRFDRLVFSPNGARLFGVSNYSNENRHMVVAYEALSGKELATLVTDASDLPISERSLDLINVDGEGRRAVVSSAHAAYLWDVDQKMSQRLDGTFRADKEQLEMQRKSLGHDLTPIELKSIALALLKDCPNMTHQ